MKIDTTVQTLFLLPRAFPTPSGLTTALLKSAFGLRALRFASSLRDGKAACAPRLVKVSRQQRFPSNFDQSEVGEQHVGFLTTVIEDDDPEVRASFRTTSED